MRWRDSASWIAQKHVLEECKEVNEFWTSLLKLLPQRPGPSDMKVDGCFISNLSSGAYQTLDQMYAKLHFEFSDIFNFQLSFEVVIFFDSVSTLASVSESVWGEDSGHS